MIIKYIKKILGIKKIEDVISNMLIQLLTQQNVNESFVKYANEVTKAIKESKGIPETRFLIIQKEIEDIKEELNAIEVLGISKGRIN
jgi:hypothetical protein